MPYKYGDLFPCSDAVVRPDNFKANVGANAEVDSEYVKATYQYATSSHSDRMQPAAIITPRVNGEFGLNAAIADVKRVVKYANTEGIAVAIRSGGHSFSGYSSTDGKNIQLDMQHFNLIQWNAGEETITVGTGTHLKDLDAELARKERFVPHGQCGWDCVGGHMQTTGFSVFCPRSFGLFIDHIVAFRVVVAPTSCDPNPQLVEVVKPVDGVTNSFNDELWYCLMGGSPGSFAVTIDVTIKPLYDKHHADTRVINRAMLYTKEKFETCVKYLAELNADDDLPADFNGSVALVEGNTSKSFDTNTNIDAAMCEKHPDIYGGRNPWSPPVMMFSTAWCNLKGAKDPFDGNVRAQEFMGGQLMMLERIMTAADRLMNKGISFAEVHLKGHCNASNVTPEKPIAMSTAIGKVTYTPRSQANPYVSASHIVDRNANKSGFCTWIADLQDEASKTANLWPNNEFVLYGGKHSMVREENCLNPKTCAPHRDASAFLLYYLHYDNVVDGKDSDKPRKAAVKNCRSVTDGAQKYMGCDKRWLAFPTSAGCNTLVRRFDNGLDDDETCLRGDDGVLDDVKQHYYDTEEKYDRVLKFKRVIDNRDTFTPHKFAIGASRKYLLAPDDSPVHTSRKM